MLKTNQQKQDSQKIKTELQSRYILLTETQNKNRYRGYSIKSK